LEQPGLGSKASDLYTGNKGNYTITLDQYGFKNSRLKELDLLNLINQILSQIDKKSSVCGIFCGLTKASSWTTIVFILHK
jgi:hypothetical protein